ncbi:MULTISPECIES: hypothetical protein [Pantoea]|nr:MULTISPECIES: hypothetical protein [Pantoea]MCU7366475.1 hypothetical protein [Pantoea stewartii]MDF7786158.1 hypothetical protein [Pantoea stewartii]MDK2636005.1 hypothetical protein [Pantoea stewartii subsp. indologenes]MEB6535666.1 hypothetical protein [Pantoea stewartii]UYK99540.1 hypothetical protein NG832_00135 [Pantoea stewartii]
MKILSFFFAFFFTFP